MMKLRNSVVVLLFFIFLSKPCAYTAKKKQYKPCKQLVLYLHEVIYTGNNAVDATSVMVAARDGVNLTSLGDQFHFGSTLVFDNPVTLNNNSDSTQVGRAQGFYFYSSKSIYAVWEGFSFLLNTTDYQGVINLVGANPITNKTRDVSIVGGTGDFFMHRGLATLTTTAIVRTKSYTLRVDLQFYECW